MEFCAWKLFAVLVEGGHLELRFEIEVRALGGVGCPSAVWVVGVLACHRGS